MYLPVDRGWNLLIAGVPPPGRDSERDDRFVYGRLTPAADPYRSRTSRSSIEGWNSGTSGSHPVRSTATSEGGVITVAAPSRGPRRCARRTRGRPAQQAAEPRTSQGSPSRRTNAPSGRSPSGARWWQLRARARRDALAVQLEVDRVGSGLARMELAPDLAQAHVVGAPAERARAMAGGERRHLVEEEQLGEAARAAASGRAPSRGTPAGTRSSAACRSAAGCARCRRACTRGCRRGARAPGRATSSENGVTRFCSGIPEATRRSVSRRGAAALEVGR